MTREEQLRLMRRDAPLALNRVLAMIETHRSDILSHAYARTDEGYEEKGDTGFQRTPRDLDDDTIEQLADAVIKQVMRRHRLRHQPTA